MFRAVRRVVPFPEQMRERVVRPVEREGKETNETMMKKRWTSITSLRRLVE